MAEDWTPEEAARRAVVDAIHERMGICDDALMARLMQVDRDSTTIFSRLEPAQNVALVQTLLLVVAAVPEELDLSEQQAMFHGLAYGLQLGHDYALEYGRLGSE